MDKLELEFSPWLFLFICSWILEISRLQKAIFWAFSSLVSIKQALILLIVLVVEDILFSTQTIKFLKDSSEQIFILFTWSGDNIIDWYKQFLEIVIWEQSK